MMTRNIYKDDIVKSIQADLVLNNHINGVFGNSIEVTSIPLEFSIRDDAKNETKYDYDHIIIQFLPTTHPARPLVDSGQSSNTSSGNFTYNIRRVFTVPIKDVKFSARCVYHRFHIPNPLIAMPTNTLRRTFEQNIFSFISNNRVNVEEDVLFGRRPSLMPLLDSSIAGLIQCTAHYAQVDQNRLSDNSPHGVSVRISNVTNDDFSVSFDVNVRISLHGGATSIVWPAEPPHHTIQRLYEYDFYIPQYIEVIVSGITYKIIPVAFQRGSKENSFEFRQNTLLTANSTIQINNRSMPLDEYRAKDIIEKWRGGKQVVNLEVTVNSEQDVRKVDSEFYILNCRYGEIEETDEQINKYSILKNANGVAKKFKVINATYKYSGSHIQRLELQELKVDDDP